MLRNKCCRKLKYETPPPKKKDASLCMTTNESRHEFTAENDELALRIHGIWLSSLLFSRT